MEGTEMEVKFGADGAARVRLAPGENPDLIRLGGNVGTYLPDQVGGDAPQLEVEGPVRAGTPIAFEGDITIVGDVDEGAVIRATGDITVKGAVQGGHLRAGGSIRIRKAIRQRAHVEAIGDVVALSAEGSTLRCEGSLAIRDDLAFCETEVGGEAVVQGRIFGGHVIADRGIRALSLGNRAGIRTQVMVIPAWRRQARITEIASELARDSARLAVVRQTLARISSRRTGTATAYLAASERRLLCAARDLDLELQVLTGKPKVEAPAGLKVETGIFPGVELQINEATLPVQAQLPPGKFVERAGRIIAARAS